MSNDQLDTGSNESGENTFSKDYVKQLRDEAAGWRTKFRELESTTKNQTVEIELANRGIKAKPSWVEIAEGQSIVEAVEAFIVENPQLSSKSEPEPKEPSSQVNVQRQIVQKNLRKILIPEHRQLTPPVNSTSNPEVKDLNKLLATRSLDDAKNDPKSREQIRDWYQSTLRERVY